MTTTTDTTTETVMCDNPDHTEYGRPTKAVARVSWPKGPYRPVTACKTDLRRQLEDAIRDGHSLHIDMIEEAR